MSVQKHTLFFFDNTIAVMDNQPIDLTEKASPYGLLLRNIYAPQLVVSRVALKESSNIAMNRAD